MNFLPSDPHELIEMLDKTYPNSCIGPNETEAQAQRRAGQRDVVQALINLRDRTARKQLKAQQTLGG